MVYKLTIGRFLISATVLLFFALLFVHGVPRAEGVQVTAALLAQAGFADVRDEQRAGDRFMTANRYFSVKDPLKKNNERATVMMTVVQSNTLSSAVPVYDYSVGSRQFVGNGAVGREALLSDGRLVINFSKGSSYVVVMGSGAEAVRKLADLITQTL